MHGLIQASTSLIPACDIPLEAYETLVQKTADNPLVSAYKIGFLLGLSVGLPKVVEVTRRYTDKPLIYDHQKAATDIPSTGSLFAKTIKEAGIDAVILFPQAGPETQKAWTEAMLEQGLGLIIGGRMTHAAYVRSDGGYLADEGITEIYQNAARMGIQHYVAPGNRPQITLAIRQLLEAEGIEPTFYSPGFLSQGGMIRDTYEAAGGRLHAIVGRAIYQADDPQKAIEELWPFHERGA